MVPVSSPGDRANTSEKLLLLTSNKYLRNILSITIIIFIT